MIPCVQSIIVTYPYMGNKQCIPWNDLLRLEQMTSAAAVPAQKRFSRLDLRLNDLQHNNEVKLLTVK